MLKMEHHKILSFLDNSHSPSLVVLAMQNWKLPRLIQKEKKAMFNCYPFAELFWRYGINSTLQKKKMSHLHKRRKEKYLSRG